jgi:hypothetical protein
VNFDVIFIEGSFAFSIVVVVVVMVVVLAFPLDQLVGVMAEVVLGGHLTLVVLSFKLVVRVNIMSHWSGQTLNYNMVAGVAGIHGGPAVVQRG